jgi:hypothetical protein
VSQNLGFEGRAFLFVDLSLQFGPRSGHTATEGITVMVREDSNIAARALRRIGEHARHIIEENLVPPGVDYNFVVRALRRLAAELFVLICFVTLCGYLLWTRWWS